MSLFENSRGIAIWDMQTMVKEERKKLGVTVGNESPLEKRKSSGLWQLLMICVTGQGKKTLLPAGVKKNKTKPQN